MSSDQPTRVPKLLGMFAKHWEPGKVKTRLAQSIGESHAATLHALFVATLTRRFRDAADRRLVAYWPPAAESAFAAVVRPHWELRPQSTGDLGQRMHGFLAAALGLAERVVLIGSDSPDVPDDYLLQAFAALAEHDLVLGPAGDGGYYLLGVARRLPPIFENIAWSTPAVWPQTISRLQAAGLAWHELPPWYDVDDEPGLRALGQRLSAADDAELVKLAAELTALLTDPRRRTADRPKHP